MAQGLSFDRQTAGDQTHAVFREGLRVMKRDVVLPQSDNEFAKAVINGKPHSITKMFAAARAVAKHASPKKVRCFGRTITAHLLDCGERAQSVLTLYPAHREEFDAQTQFDKAQDKILAKQLPLTVGDYDAAILAGENQIAATEVYIETLRAERAALLGAQRA